MRGEDHRADPAASTFESTPADCRCDKDALDVLRLLRGTQTADLAARYRHLLNDGRSSATAIAGRALFEEQFATRTGIGVEMAARASAPLVDAAEVAASAEVLAGDLLRALPK